MAENELFNFLPKIYNILKSIEDSQDIIPKIKEFKQQIERAKLHVKDLPGINLSPGEQLKLEDYTQKQVVVKTELLEKYRKISVENYLSLVVIPHFPIFGKDNQYFDIWKVNLMTIDGTLFCGWVYTIDPVTHNWVIMDGFNDGAAHPCIHVVMNSSVTGADIIDDKIPDSILNYMGSYSSDILVTLTTAEMTDQRDRICKWFNVNRIPVTVSGDRLVVADGVLTIQPPYSPESCYSTNEIILSKIRSLLVSMPLDDNSNKTN